MKVIDCNWELRNINKKTVEISIEENEFFEEDVINQMILGYEYVVIKVPMNMPAFNFGLTKMGYVNIETQMNVGIDLENFDFSTVSHLFKDTTYKHVVSQEDLYSIISNIEPGMFSTDRISIDPVFGEEIGCRRYINWLTTEFESKRSQLVQVFYCHEHVGFLLFRVINDTIKIVLNGLYKPFHGKGLGLLTPASALMYSKEKSLPITKAITCISSNNIPVVKLYNKLRFQLLQQTYVFVTHKTYK